MLTDEEIKTMALNEPIVYVLYKKYLQGEMTKPELVANIARQLFVKKMDLQKLFEEHVSMNASNNNLMRPIHE